MAPVRLAGRTTTRFAPLCRLARPPPTTTRLRDGQQTVTVKKARMGGGGVRGEAGRLREKGGKRETEAERKTERERQKGRDTTTTKRRERE